MGNIITPRNGVYLSSEDCGDKINYYEANLARIGIKDCEDCDKHCHLFGDTLPTIQFIVTESCNLNCSYCYELCKTNKFMSKEVAKKGVDFILNNGLDGYFDKNDHIGGFIIEFFGGEPTLNIDVMEYVADYFTQQCYLKHPEWLANSMFAVSSNGTLYFEPKVKNFVETNSHRLSFGITIDGNKTLHDACRVYYDGRGSYDDVEKAVKHWNTISTTTNSTKVTFAPGNIEYLYDSMIHLWENLDIQFIHANCVFEEGWTLDHAKIYYRELMRLADYLLTDKRYGRYHTTLFSDDIREMDEDSKKRNTCGGNGSMLAISPDGKLYTCMRFMDYALGKQKGQSIGDLDNGIDLDAPFLKKLQALTFESQSEEKCLACPASSICGGCTGYNYDASGDPNIRPTYHCDMIKVQAIVSAYLYNKIFEIEGINKHIEMPFDDSIYKN